VGRITRAWDRYPYGIGIACGPAGLVVIDLDTAKGEAATGAETLAELEHQSGSALPATWTVGTPSGGRHLYYRRPSAGVFGNTAARVGPGIDTRALGGYVVAPPTTTDAGEYWLIDDHPPSELPDWFGQLVNAPERTSPINVASHCSPTQRAGSDRSTSHRLDRYVAAALAAEQERILSAAEGRRNHTLFSASIAVGQLVGAQLLDRLEAEQILLQAAQAHVAAGAYGGGQARQTIASGLRRGSAEPRQLPMDFYATQGASS